MITARFYAKKLSHNVWFCFLPSTFLLASPWKLSLISQFSSSSSLMMITFAEKSVLVARVLTLYQRNSDMFKNCHAAGVCGRPCSVSFTHLLINGWYTTTSPLLYNLLKLIAVVNKSLGFQVLSSTDFWTKNMLGAVWQKLFTMPWEAFSLAMLKF